MQTTNILKETLVYPGDLPGRPSRRSVYRWRKIGGRNPRTGKFTTLDWCYLHGRVVTSREAYERYVRKTNGENPCERC